MIELWAAVPGFVGLYEVSSLGRVRSLHGEVPCVLKQSLDTAGYPMVTLWTGDKKLSRNVHRLVCEAFNGPPTILHTEVAHLDGTRNNNRPHNLKWASKAENAHHRHWHGTHPGGENHPRAKLSSADVHIIRRLLADGHDCGEISRKFGVHNATIQDIKKKRKWRGLKHESAAATAETPNLHHSSTTPGEE